MKDGMQEALNQFLQGVQPPARGKLFRLKYWALTQLYRAGEWATAKINDAQELTNLEKVYWACSVSNMTPKTLRDSLVRLQDAALTQAAIRAAQDGVKQ